MPTRDTRMDTSINAASVDGKEGLTVRIDCLASLPGVYSGD